MRMYPHCSHSVLTSDSEYGLVTNEGSGNSLRAFFYEWLLSTLFDASLLSNLDRPAARMKNRGAVIFSWRQ
jgi:hypothetical protein